MAVSDGERQGSAGPDFPAGDLLEALEALGRRFLEVLDSVVEVIGGRAVKVKPLEDLDGFDLDRNRATFRGEVPPMGLPVVPSLAVPRDEVRLMMGGREVGRARFDGGTMQGEVLDPGAIAQLRAGLLGGLSIKDDGLAGHADCSRGYAAWVADSRRKP
ncbi:hypothetical protein HYQ03_gp65 [Arthrobacter phage Kuleana]|uniref:Uncharacterized protein n=1 Tax=Arthrobacter phage Kuleana TaxID=2653270 RepID=A0A5Q2W8N7_9CAUD|nr:hypothetical protein HYQ03_gp65 [Arthrobacter phage Kuleana]QGH74552.1 hypothetical protein SEA_KULEANA_65 [Arthrobacter phage Kuleana]